MNHLRLLAEYKANDFGVDGDDDNDVLVMNDEKQPITEQISSLADQLLKKSSQMFKETASIVHIDHATNYYTRQLKSHLKAIHSAYFQCKRFPLKLKLESRRELAEDCLRSGTISALSEIVCQQFGDETYYCQDRDLAKNHLFVLKKALSILVNFSDCNEMVSHYIRDDPLLLQHALHELQSWQDLHLSNGLKVMASFLHAFLTI